MASKKLTDKDKQKLIDKLAKETGINSRRCKTFLEKFNWDYNKTLEIPVIKSAIQKNKPSEKPVKVKEEEKPKKEVEKPKADKKKQSKSTKKSKPKIETIPTRKRTNGGIEYTVDIINGKDYFNGKEIRADGSGFYHPYPTMKQIIKWVNEFGPGKKKK